jgi:flagellar biosynthesis protein FlhA
VRVALGRLIVQQIVGMGKEMPVITIEPNLEQILHHTVQTMTGGSLAIEPGLAARMLKSLKNLHEQQEIRGEPAVLVVADNLRDFLSRFVRAHIREFHILAFREVPDNIGIRITGVVGGEEAVS